MRADNVSHYTNSDCYRKSALLGTIFPRARVAVPGSLNFPLVLHTLSTHKHHVPVCVRLASHKIYHNRTGTQIWFVTVGGDTYLPSYLFPKWER